MTELEQNEAAELNALGGKQLLSGDVPQTEQEPDIVDRLRNPMWAHGNVPFESPQLDKEENVAAMMEAAEEIERLRATPAPSACREALEPFAKAADQLEKFKDNRPLWIALDKTFPIRDMIPLTVGDLRRARAALSAAQSSGEAKWHLASMNDGLFIINATPRPSTDDIWPDRPDGPTIVLNVTELPAEKARKIVDVLNAAPVASCSDLEITKAEIMATAETVLTLRKMEHSKCSEEMVQPIRLRFEAIISSLNCEGIDTDSLTVGEIRRAL